MTRRNLYGQFCPIAMSTQLIGGRWTILIIRELLDGPARFNEIHRGVPLISRSLLSTRLKELEAAGLVDHARSAHRNHARYALTRPGRELGKVVAQLGEWGQEWLATTFALRDIDDGYLMWSIKRRARRIEGMRDPFVVEFLFSDAPQERPRHWLVMEDQQVDVCFVDPCIGVDVLIETDLKTFTAVWMGWEDPDDMIASGSLRIDGPDHLVKQPFRWLGRSVLSRVPKQPENARLMQ